MSTKTEATIEDLYYVPDNAKAELIDGEIVPMAPTGYLPGYAAGEIFSSLRAHARETKSGTATTDNFGFRVDLPNRGSFSPDAAFYTGKPTGMKFLEGAPVFAVEVRSEGDYGQGAEGEMARKRADYFAAGTLVVWDVNMLSPDVVRSYDVNHPDEPVIYHRGDRAKAELAVPGWSIAVDDLFPEA
ncbi:MAG: Uma2 family endonuclease [Acidobacteriota bacterium]